VIDSGAGSVRWSKPVIYQSIGNERRAVEGRFAIRSRGRVGFEVGGYDRTRTLVIDPVLSFLDLSGQHWK